MEKKSNKKGMGVIIALAVAILLVVSVATIAIVNMIKENGGLKKAEDTSLYSRIDVTNTTKDNGKNDFFDLEETQKEDVELESNDNNIEDGFVDVEAGDVVTSSATKPSEEYDPIAEYEKLTKNGDNQLSDHHNNKFIKLVSGKYNVDTDLLVAIYSEPDTGNNFVLEFNGKKDEDGNIVKSPDTLAKVYSIDKNKNICVATGKTTGNENISYAEGMLCFNMIKKIVMPQYPDYFTGVEN